MESTNAIKSFFCCISRGTNLRYNRSPLTSQDRIRLGGTDDNEAVDVQPCRFRAARHSGRLRQQRIPNK